MLKFLTLFFSLLLTSQVYSAYEITQKDLDVFNKEYSKLLKKLGPIIEKRLHDTVMAELADLKEKTKNKSKRLHHYEAPRFNFTQFAPGYHLDDQGRLQIQIPHGGKWDFKVKVWGRIKKKFYRQTSDLDLQLRNIQIALPIKLVPTGGGRIVLDEVAEPIISADLKIDASGATKFIAKLFDGNLEDKLKKAIRDGAKQAKEHVEGYIPYSLSPVGEARPFKPTPKHPHLETIARNVDQKIFDTQMVHDTIVARFMDTPAYTTWEQAYGPEGDGNIGKAIDYVNANDVAIWSGTYLASSAFRYAVLKDQETLKMLRRQIRGLERLLEINGNTGLLSRSVAPANSHLGKKMIAKNEVFSRRMIDGEMWVGKQGKNGISRDQYAGMFMGLLVAHEVVDKRGIKKRSRRLIKMMLDYIIRNDWMIHDDRGTYSDPKVSSFPTVWAGINYQKVNLLTIADHLFPGQYKAQLREAQKLINTTWIPIYLAMLEPATKYYKFNLEHTHLYTYFLLEKNKDRRHKMKEVIEMMRYYIGHHKNAWFDLVTYSIDPVKYSHLKVQIEESIKSFVRRPHRYYSPEWIKDADFEHIVIDQPGRGKNRITAYPLDPELRHHTSEFLWQREPFRLMVNTDGLNPKREALGLDLTLVYWMARYYEILE